ncbi:ATP-binding protein [Ornithinibacillus contaminans]|uniref:ATP-binding protein n=1 Tax=Ornithinibacillus contaminans TaxID=694055 RepID=UPI0007ECA974|nr:ATP-binding protein [Ornithinibacillus contaminans]
MKTAVLDFPIKHIDGNLVFGHDGSVTAYYQVSGFNYEFLSHDDKFIPYQSQTAYLFNNSYDLHFMVEPFPTSIEEIINSTIEDMEYKDYELKENGIKYMDMLKKALLDQQNSKETSDYHDYLGVQLNPELEKFKDGNAGTNMINSFKDFLKGISSQINRANGLNPDDILESEIANWREQSETLMESIRTAYNCGIKPATTAESVYLVEKEFSVSQSNNDIQVRRGFSSGDWVQGFDDEGRAQNAIRPTEKSFVEIQNTDIEEVSPTTLRFSKVLEDDSIQSQLVKYLVVHKMDTENYFPNAEWLYHLKTSIPFPVSVSIRAYHQSNERITKRLSNKRLEFKDQRAHANQAGESTDLSLDTSEQGAIQAENYLTKTGQPAYQCSIVFKLTAEDEKTLNSRTKILRDRLVKYGIKIVAPYGEQLNLMMEKILGSRQINQDYKIETDSGVIASMMFGATTNIGDNRGIFIGYTQKMHRPVFIQPDLAAKAFDGLGNVEDSISMLVAGATGKGKSYAMNLVTYLSVLTGSQALVIDPKGDREGWESLPLIPSHFISKWTLGSSREDAGCLDPFRTSVDIEEGKSIVLDILSYLIDANIKDMEYTVISEAVDEIGKTNDPCIGAVINILEEQKENREEGMSEKRYEALESVIGTLNSLKKQKLSVLLFGEVNQNYKVLKVDKPLQILMVENLNLPDKNVKKIRPSQKISEAIMISITSFTKQYMLKQDRSRHKIILQDEASSVDNSPVGRELMDFIVRKGRYYNTTLLKGSQNATDHGEDVANMGMKFSFGLRKKEEAEKMLEFFNLPNTQDSVNKLRSFSKGYCLFQDIYGRSAVIKIDPIFIELAKAFDSSTSTEEEKERERNKANNFVEGETEKPREVVQVS